MKEGVFSRSFGMLRSHSSFKNALTYRSWIKRYSKYRLGPGVGMRRDLQSKGFLSQRLVPKDWVPRLSQGYLSQSQLFQGLFFNFEFFSKKLKIFQEDSILGIQFLEREKTELPWKMLQKKRRRWNRLVAK